jgi:short-subunit dehydrogenase
MATYCATKAFVKSFSEAVASEASGTGVNVLCVCPGFTRTEFQTRAEVDVSRVPSFAWMSAEAVVDEAVRAVGRRAVMVSGTMNSMTASVIRLLPTSISGRIFGAALRR